MRRILMLAALLGTALPLGGQTQSTVTANITQLTGAAVPDTARVRTSLINCGPGNTPRVSGVSILGENYHEFLLSGGQLTATLYRNDVIECGGQTGLTRYVVEVYDRGTLVWPPHRYNINKATFDLDQELPESAVPPAPIPDYAIRGGSNTFSGGTQDFESAAVTRPFRRLPFASFPATCTANREFLERSDPAAAGQVLYVCNAAGDGWDPAGDGAGGTGHAFSIVFKSPAVSDSGKVQYKFAQAVTLLRISCSTDTGSVDINFDARSEATPNTAGNGMLLSDLTCGDPTASTTSFVSAAVPAQAPLNLQVNGVTGSPTIVRISVEYKF